MMMSMTGYRKEDIKEEFLLHWQVWHRNVEQLQEVLVSKLHDKEKQDPHKRSPLHLAVTLGYTDCARVLLKAGCDPNSTNKEGWNAVQEAVGVGDPELISLVIQYREFDRLTQRTGGIPETLEALEQADDFYLEMRWEFTSWLPFVSRMCPSDTYKIWKSGPNVRVDTTLVGFDQMSWQRGNQSFIFKGGERSSCFLEIDHEKKTFWKESVKLKEDSVTLESLTPPQDMISSRITSPNVTTHVDSEKIAFTRQKSGFLGWGGDKTENIHGYEAKVYSVLGVEIITRTRTEHMTQEDRERFKAERSRLQSQQPAFLNFFHHDEEETNARSDEIVDKNTTNPYNLDIEDYFNPKDSPGKDIGNLRVMTSKAQKFSATMALCDSFPLSLQDQVLPIINLMANSNSHFAKLRDFITLQLPAGFPIKIEIPLFRVLNARVTFGNLNGTESCPDKVVTIETQEEDDAGPSDETEEDSLHRKVKCLIDKSVFVVPTTYRDLGAYSFDRQMQGGFRDEEDELLQLAIQQSLLDSPEDDVTFYEALDQPIKGTDNDLLQRAIQESLQLETHVNDEGRVEIVNGRLHGGRQTDSQIGTDHQGILSNRTFTDSDLRVALEMSQCEMQEAERLRKQEDEELDRILKLSMTEK